MLSVRWGKHETELLSHLFRYFSGEAFVDVTLWCSGRRFKAHRVMLSACSVYLESVLLEHPSCAGEPVTVLLHGVEAEQLRRLLELMYRGHTTVSAGELPSLLDTAAALGVRLLHSAALRVAAADVAAASPKGHLDMETSYPSKKGVETARLVMMDTIPPCAAVSPIRQFYESSNDGAKADKGEVATVTPPPPTPPPPSPPPPQSSPASTQPPPVSDPHELLPGPPTTPPHQTSTVDWPHFPLLTYPLGMWYPQAQQRPESPHTELGVGVQTRAHPDAGCGSDYSTPAPVPVAIGHPDSFQHHVAPVTTPHGMNSNNPPVSQAEKANGSWVKTDDHCDTIHHPHQSRVAWGMQPSSGPFQQQVKLRDGSTPLQDATREVHSSLPPQDADDHHHQKQQQHTSFGALDNSPSYETQPLPHGQPPPWSPKSGGTTAKKQDDLWLMDQPPVQTGSPTRVFTELLPPKSGSQPTFITSITVSSTVDGLQGSWRPELKNEYIVKPAYAGNDDSQFQTQQSLVPGNQQQPFSRDNTVEEMTKTKTKDGKENVCETCNKTFATRFSLT